MSKYKKERNEAIYSLFINGMSAQEIANDFLIKRQRVYAIVNKISENKSKQIRKEKEKV